jgi:hypothetical protein
MQSVAVVVSESGEGGLGFPGHVGVGVAETVLQDFDHSPAGHVEVFAGVAAVRQAVADEGAREGGGDALGGEDVQQLAQVGGLLLLIADVVAVEPDRGDPVVLDDLSASGAVVSRAAMGGAAELGDRDRLALGDQCADALLVDVGDFLRAVEVDRDDVERRPVNALERDGGIGDLAAESLANHGDGSGEELVDAGGQPGQQLTHPWLAPEQATGPLLEAVARQEPGVEQAQLGTGDEHDLGSPAANLLGTLGGGGEQIKHRLGAELVGKRREPDLQAQVGGVERGEFELVQIIAEQAYRSAVQVVADDLQLAPDELVVERSAGNAVETESGVVPDTLGSQGSFVLRGFFDAIELHTRFPFEHFLPQTRQQEKRTEGHQNRVSAKAIRPSASKQAALRLF